MATTPAQPICDVEIAEREARLSVEALVQALARTMRIAGSLVRNGSRVDLTGLDRMAALLAARALDLRPDHARSLEPRFQALLSDLDRLFAALAPPALN